MSSAKADVPTDFEEVALPVLKDVARFAFSLTQDESEADDLVQSTYLAAFKNWHRFEPGTYIKRWLFTICRNTFLKGRRRAHRLVFSEEADLDALHTVYDHIHAQNEGLGDLFDRIDVRPAIEQAVEALPEPHRSIIILVDLEDMSYEEAAEVLEVPIGTVRSRLFRARRKIQEALVEHARDHGIATPAADTKAQADT